MDVVCGGARGFRARVRLGSRREADARGAEHR
jgi:hypothetical protein